MFTAYRQYFRVPHARVQPDDDEGMDVFVLVMRRGFLERGALVRC